MTAADLATTKGKEFALKALAERRVENATKERINNADLWAGSPMYFYCKSCGGQSDVLPESYIPGPNRPKKLCDECQALKDLDWLE
jgi:hypothetical protein